MTHTTGSLVETVLAEVLRDSHRYAPGLEQRRTTLVKSSDVRWRRTMGRGLDRSRDLLERTAAAAGFTRRHFDPAAAAERLNQMLGSASELQTTYERLGDEASRRALIDLLKLKVLGPYHAPLPITPEQFRARQVEVETQMRVQEGTYEVSDPWFSPLSLYTVPVDGGRRITLHDHSVDIVSVFLLGQYSYVSGKATVGVEPGDTVLDLGGCWGDTALYFASLVGSGGKVYSFEFDPENLAILHANLDLNPDLAKRIEIVEHAVWDRSGETLRFTQAGRCTYVGDNHAGAGDLAVPTITIDDFIDRAGIDRVSFVKMDVEGAELHALAGAKRCLSRMAPKLAIAAYHKDDDLIEIPAQISSLGVDYQLYLGTYSAAQEETVLFADATARNSSI